MYVMHTGEPEEFDANFQEIEDRTLKASDIPEWLKAESYTEKLLMDSEVEKP